MPRDFSSGASSRKPKLRPEANSEARALLDRSGDDGPACGQKGSAPCHDLPKNSVNSRKSVCVGPARTNLERHRQVLLEMARTWTQAALEAERGLGLIYEAPPPQLKT